MKKVLLAALCLLLSQIIFAQGRGTLNTKKWRKTESDSLVTAQNMFEQQAYLLALPIFDKLLNEHPKELYLKYVTGVSGLYRSDMHQKSLEYLEEVYRVNKKVTDIELDLSKAYHFNYKLDEAQAMLDAFKKRKPKEELLKIANKLADNIAYSKELMAKPSAAKFVALDKNINSPFSEFYPHVSSDESFIVYTYTGDKSTGGTQNGTLEPDPLGDYYEDIFYSNKTNNSWAEAKALSELVNTNAVEVAIGISNDAQTVYLFKDDGLTGGDIYFTKYTSQGWTLAEKLRGDINSFYWESDVSVSADGRTMFFSSARPGGYGGKDLFRATLQADSTWGNVQNLGVNINSVGDEDAPYIHPDGRTLIFSSNGLKTMGGSDLFVSYLNWQDSTWSTPVNLGYPINSPEDDFSLELNVSGQRAYISSSKSTGMGMDDIYVIEMSNEIEKPVLASVSGIITYDGKAVSAQIIATEQKTNKVFNTVYSRADNGKYLINLPKGKDYVLTYRYHDLQNQVKNIEATNITLFAEIKNDVAFVKEPELTVKDLNELKTDVAASTKEKAAEQKIIETKAKPAKANPSEEEVAKRSVNTAKEGLVYKIQVGAFKIPRNFKAVKIEDLGKIEKEPIDGGITCITIGSFDNLNDALNFKKKVINAGIKDAFIIANYNGKRKYVYELEKMGVLK
jgi:tetratricopeptide (TPR) repeat protein